MRMNCSFPGKLSAFLSAAALLLGGFGLFFASSAQAGFGYNPGTNLSGTGAQRAYDAGIFGSTSNGATQNADGTVSVNGYTFDPYAVARAILSGIFDDSTADGKQFLEMLKAYAIDNPNTYSNVTPEQLLQYLENVTAGTQYDDVVANADTTANYNDASRQALKKTATTVGKEVNTAAATGASRTSVKAWATTKQGATADEDNAKLGLWYDAEHETIKYLNADGQRTNIVAVDANNYKTGSVMSSSDVSACVEAFGGDDDLGGDPSSTGTGHTAGSIGSGPKGSGSASTGGTSSGSTGNSGSTGSSGSTTTVSPTVTNNTNSTQTISAPTLAVSTDRAATCQFKKDSSFTYGNGTTFDTTGGLGHTYKLNSLVNGSYTYYVACEDSATGGKSTAIAITFTVDLSKDLANAPTVANTTGASFTTATTTLSVNTNTPSKCEYNESGGFSFGSGTLFSTTGSYSHNTSLAGLANGTHTYYAVCKDNATGAVSTALRITFTVNLADSANAPTIISITTVTQTGNSPVLAVTTDIPATCQYKQGSTFTYGGGSPMTAASEGYSHSVSISSLADAAYNFYVVCKSNDTAAISTAKLISTTLDRPDVNSSEPKITNTTVGYQTVNDPTLSLTTDIASTCQYKTSSFTYGGGTAFSTTGSTNHNVKLSNIDDGTYSYYVVCKASTSGVVNASAFQISFTTNVKAAADNCADLSSNDRQNDGDRSDSNTKDDNTNYLWQAVESGKREKFDQVDWFAGYQFSLNEDGYATELCGYFEDGETNNVILFNGSYKALATAKVTGTGSWECTNIDKVKLSADTRYYVITQVENQAIYYEYKSGFLPVDTGNAVIEAGIRQTVNSTFNKDIVKYDYMIFGLVDVKISYATDVTKGPKITSTGPSGTVNDSSAYISVEADKNSTCRFDRDDVDYKDMSYTLQQAANGTYSQLVCNLHAGDFTFYVRCADKDGKENDASTAVEFTVEN